MIITVSNDLKRILNNKVPEVPKDKFLEIPNGYDPEDFSKTKTTSRNETFTLVYAGTLTLDYPVESLYSSLKIILNKSSNSLSLKIAGRPAEECVKYLYELSNRYSNFQFESLGYISHQKSVKLMESSDMLLLLIPDLPNNKGILTGKIFEYIGSGRPIWGFGPKDGDAQDILQECKAGELHDLPKSAAFALENHMNKAVEGASKIQRKKYTREGLAQKLLNQLLEKIDH